MASSMLVNVVTSTSTPYSCRKRRMVCGAMYSA